MASSWMRDGQAKNRLLESLARHGMQLDMQFTHAGPDHAKLHYCRIRLPDGLTQSFVEISGVKKKDAEKEAVIEACRTLDAAGKLFGRPLTAGERRIMQSSAPHKERHRGGEQREDWFADSPKQFFFNAFQNNGWGLPALRSRIFRGMCTCTVELPAELGSDGAPVVLEGRGRNKKLAENDAALQGCRLLNERGLMRRSSGPGSKRSRPRSSTGSAGSAAASGGSSYTTGSNGGGSDPTAWWSREPKRFVFEVWQRMKWGRPQFEFSQSRQSYGRQGGFTCTVPLSSSIASRLQVPTPPQDSRWGGGAPSAALSGNGRSKKDAQRAVSLRVCEVLEKQGLLTQGASAGAPLSPFTVPLPSRHWKGTHRCEKGHGYEPPPPLTFPAELVEPLQACIASGEFTRRSTADPTVMAPPPPPAAASGDRGDGSSRDRGRWEEEEDSSRSEDDRLSRQLSARLEDPSFASMMKQRQGLPAFQYADDIVRAVRKNQVVVVAGETGSGKTTQVPQLLLDEGIRKGRGSTTRILVTQPRRLAAISVAQRVAQERQERLGESVGYQVRLESVRPQRYGHISFCTTGILLRRLIGASQRGAGGRGRDGGASSAAPSLRLPGVSHIVVDEVHERDVQTDFLLLVLRELLVSNPQISLVLMSATINPRLFSTYFHRCPVVSIPGKLFPVQPYFLEDTLAAAGISARDISAMQPQHKRRRGDGGSSYGGGGGGYGGMPEQQEDTCPVEICAAVVRYIHRQCGEGAVLVFLPGLSDIRAVTELLRGDRSLQVVALHSQLVSSDQQAVFSHPPPGMRKVVLSTNIAETSLTIDDVVYVVDGGRHKQKWFDPLSEVSCLQTKYVSQASMRQRRGRAGRCQPGVSFHLIPSAVARNLPEYEVPEMQRVGLEEVCLQLKAMGMDTTVFPPRSARVGMGAHGSYQTQSGAARVLSHVLEPPGVMQIRRALHLLTSLGALDEQEALTQLGRSLAQLPVHPRVGKMLILGGILGCLDPVLTIAAGVGGRDPFVAPLHARESADRARVRMAGDSCSDHWVLVSAYNGWLQARSSQGDEGRRYCSDHYLSHSTMRNIHRTRRQFNDLLRDSGLQLGAAADRHSGDTSMVRAVLAACLFPNVAELYNSGGAGKPKLRTRDNCQLKLHPRSVLSKSEADPGSRGLRWLVYQGQTRSALSQSLFAETGTALGPWHLALFGASPVVHPQSTSSVCGLLQDGWLSHTVATEHSALLLDINHALQELLQRTIFRCKRSGSAEAAADPRAEFETQLVDLVAKLLSQQQQGGSRHSTTSNQGAGQQQAPPDNRQQWSQYGNRSSSSDGGRYSHYPSSYSTQHQSAATDRGSNQRSGASDGAARDYYRQQQLSYYQAAAQYAAMYGNSGSAYGGNYYGSHYGR